MIAVLVLGFLLLAMGIPSTGYIVTEDNPPPADMWRVAKFAIHPDSFFIWIGAVMIQVLCVLIGLIRRSKLELIGWSLLGLLVILMLFAS